MIENNSICKDCARVSLSNNDRVPFSLNLRKHKNGWSNWKKTFRKKNWYVFSKSWRWWTICFDIYFFCHQLKSKNLEGDKLFRVLLCSKNEMCFTKFINGKLVLCCHKETCVDNVCTPHVIEACQLINEEPGERQDNSWMMLVIPGFVLVFSLLLRRFYWKQFTQLHGE